MRALFLFRDQLNGILERHLNVKAKHCHTRNFTHYITQHTRITMKLIVAGATGLVGSEIIRQSLEISEITSIIALARKPIQIEESDHSSKLKSVVVSDYGDYPDHVKAALAGADACIW